MGRASVIQVLAGWVYQSLRSEARRGVGRRRRKK